MKTAILIDGAFFLKRYKTIFGSNMDPKVVAKNMYTLALAHLNYKENKEEKRSCLYRILYYDCWPFSKKIQNPISKRTIDFSKTPEAYFRLAFFEELKKKRKVALRLGYLKDKKNWVIYPRVCKDFIKNKKNFSQLQDTDIFYHLLQKGVDIRIGVDIASLAYKKLVDQIILVSGDSDFVPAAKLARREGIDFVLDPMWNNIDPSLHEHIDGLKSTCPKPKRI